MSRHEDTAWQEAPESDDVDPFGPGTEDRDTIETPAPVCVCCKVERATTLDRCRDCDVGMCGCGDEKTIADIETQIDRLHFFMTVSPFEGIR